MSTLSPLPLPPGITSSYISCAETTGLNIHILSAGSPTSPLLLFCHGFPELAYSWRHILPALADKGYYCVAFDQRGYGRTTGHDTRSYANLDLHSYGPWQNVVDIMALVRKLGRNHVDVIIGHDFGAVSAASCAMMRPDFFRAVVIMSHPFDALPDLPGPVNEEQKKDSRSDPDIQQSLALIGRKHYKLANSTSTAAAEWDNPAQGMKEYLRGYMYLKSASDKRNVPQPLKAWNAEELSQMPHYYVQKLHLSMPETVAEDVQGQEAGLAAMGEWLVDEELDVYASEWVRTGFGAALSWYRNRTVVGENQDMLLFSGKGISVPSVFISGREDWGNYQKPGALEALERTCSDFRGIRFIDSAGHWPQQEQPRRVLEEIERFLAMPGIVRS